MTDYTLVVYSDYDTVNPYLVHYTGDRNGAIQRACEERAKERTFEIDVYQGTFAHPEDGFNHDDIKSVCVVMYSFIEEK